MLIQNATSVTEQSSIIDVFGTKRGHLIGVSGLFILMLRFDQIALCLLTKFSVPERDAHLDFPYVIALTEKCVNKLVMVLVTQNKYKVMVRGTTHVSWVQHRSPQVQHQFENPRLRCVAFENSF